MMVEFIEVMHYLQELDNKLEKEKKLFLSNKYSEMGIENLDSFDMENLVLDNILKILNQKEVNRTVFRTYDFNHIDHSFNINEQILMKNINKFWK